MDLDFSFLQICKTTQRLRFTFGIQTASIVEQVQGHLRWVPFDGTSDSKCLFLCNFPLKFPPVIKTILAIFILEGVRMELTKFEVEWVGNNHFLFLSLSFYHQFFYFSASCQNSNPHRTTPCHTAVTQRVENHQTITVLSRGLVGTYQIEVIR